ncbi:MAG TPA: ThiF family adenylyltransferase [Pseudomonadales bacterium]|nr:ThiF family adenylyltransferase [Pseudomonadales bacterium]
MADSNLLALINTKLDQRLTGRWSVASTTDLHWFRKNAGAEAAAAWQIDLEDGDITYPGTNRICIGIDKKYPLSQPTVWLPEYKKNKAWPHIEASGKLCLTASSTFGDPFERIIQHLAWAQELLSMSPTARRKDFYSEFCTYWGNHCDEPQLVYSWLSLNWENRIIATTSQPEFNRFFVADSVEQLQKNMAHLGSKDNSILPGYLFWLDIPWQPDQFPDFGSALLEYIPDTISTKLLAIGKPCPIIIGVKSNDSAMFVAAILQSQTPKMARHGFRPRTILPHAIVRNAFSTKKIKYAIVRRTDGAWVHGRDRDPQYHSLSKKSVIICGCGSLGASVARLLAQSGVGAFYLIDNDFLEPHNASRHLLGVGKLVKLKTEALKESLLSDFPHMNNVTTFPKNFEEMTIDELKQISTADVIVSAGISTAGDLLIDQWRVNAHDSIAHVCTWSEAFASAGHAVALFGKDSIRDAFDENGEVRFRLSDTPTDASHMVSMAGCGNLFQPYGAIELQHIVNIGASLTLEVLTGKTVSSKRRVWYGDRESAHLSGLLPRQEFDRSLCIQDIALP